MVPRPGFPLLLTTLSFLALSAATPIKRATALPSYVLTYAPYTHLWSQEEWWPSDIATHVQHVTPEVNYVAVSSTPTLKTLSSLASNVFLTSNDNVEDDPAWLLSASNKPSSGGKSAAPATIIAVDKGNGIVDAFYFYFYSYNHGNKVLGIQFGNHVGDWEHTMVRFTNGVPSYIYLSAHSGGTAYTYDALPKTNGRATTYVAGGSHANYVSVGKQSYSAPFGLLSDTTDAGPYWDVTQNYRGFWYDNSAGTFSSAGGVGTGATEQASEGVSWLSYAGAWGDQQYPTSDSRQNCVSSECHYVSGPTGPLAKNLGRTQVCEKSDCTIKTSI